jgi:hypothetical protein
MGLRWQGRERRAPDRAEHLGPGLQIMPFVQHECATQQKLNWLQRHLPEGLAVDAGWLEARGYSRSLRSQYVAAGWLAQPARGVFCRPRGKLSWEQIVISLQAPLGYQVSVSGRTALEFQGYAHYVPQFQQAVHLYGTHTGPRPNQD